MRGAVALGLGLILAGCGDRLSPEEQARRDAADVAFIAAAQKQRAPAQPIAPQVLLASDRSKLPVGESECGLLPRDGASNDPVIVLGPVAGHIKLDGALATFAADTGSAMLRGGIYRKYAGKAYALELGEGEGATGWLTIKDSPGRTVYMTAGTWVCSTP